MENNSTEAAKFMKSIGVRAGYICECQKRKELHMTDDKDNEWEIIMDKDNESGMWTIDVLSENGEMNSFVCSESCVRQIMVPIHLEADRRVEARNARIALENKA